MISVVIPSRNERFLKNTIEDLLSKAEGEVEIIAILDGYWVELPEDSRLRIIHRGKSMGMRAGINAGVSIARGEFILKADAHTLWGQGWDKILAADCEDNWVVVPTRKRLDAENWKIQDNGKPDIDYMYLAYPENASDFGGKGLNGKVWDEKNRDMGLRKEKLIDDLMSSQGSAWFMKKKYFYELQLMDEIGYGSFWNEFQEIGLKCWLSGGRVIVNKKTFYAHLHKGKKYGRGYDLDHKLLTKGARFTNNWMKFGKAWRKQTLPLSWLIEKFMPVPTWTEEKIKLLKENENTK